MNTNKLIVVLLRGNKLMNDLTPEAVNVKVGSQLMGVAIAFYDLATQLRSGKLQLTADALSACIDEVQEACDAAEAAVGKTDAERALAVVEGNEAISLIYSHAQTRQYELSALTGYMAAMEPRISQTRLLDGLTVPWPYPITGPGTWPRPPRPLPRPWPWPWPPGPWPPGPWPIDEYDMREFDRSGGLR